MRGHGLGTTIFHKLLFEVGAAPYDLLTRHRVWKTHCRNLLAPLPRMGKRRVIDLGCGPAMSAIAIAEQFPGDEVLGLDLAAKMLTRAQRNAATAGVRIPFLRGSALELPIASACADVVTGHSFLYLLPDRARALREIHRILKPGGHLVLMEPIDRARLRNAFNEGLELRFTASMLLWRIASGTAGRFSPASLTQALEAAGFVDVQAEPTMHGMGIRAQGRRP